MSETTSVAGTDRESVRTSRRKSIQSSSGLSKTKKKSHKDERNTLSEHPIAELSSIDEKSPQKLDSFSWKGLSELEAQVREIEEERDALTTQKEFLLADFKEKEANYLKQIEAYQTQREQMNEKLQRIERVESAIIELYVEMKDRSGENPDAPLDKVKEANELKRSSPLIVLDLLRASLKTLLNFKLDYEKEVRGKTKQEKIDEYNMFELKSKVQEMQSDLSQTRMLLASTTDKHTLVQTQLSKLAQTSAKTIEELQKDNLQLIEMMRSKEEELSELREKCGTQESDINNLNIRLARIPELEAQVQSNSMQHQLEMQKSQSQTTKTIRDMETRLQKLVKLENDNRSLQERLNKAETDLLSYKSHIGAVRMKEMEQTSQKLQKKVQTLTEEVDALKHELRRSQKLADDYFRKNASLKEEYDQLFKRVSDERMKRKVTETNKSVDYHKMADNIPSHIAVYKEKIREKDREIAELTNKIRRLVAAEHHKGLMEKSYEIERSRYQKELAELKTVIQNRKESRSSSPFFSDVGMSSENVRLLDTGTSQSSLPRRPWSSTSMVSNTAASNGRRVSRPSSVEPNMVSRAMADSVNMDMFNQTEEVDELRRKNDYLESQLREFENLKSISVATAKAYEHLLKRTSRQGHIGDSQDEDEKDSHRAWGESDGEDGVDSPDPEDRTTILRISAPRKLGTSGDGVDIPKSASMKKSSLNVGGNKLSTKVGVLL